MKIVVDTMIVKLYTINIDLAHQKFTESIRIRLYVEITFSFENG